MVRALIPVGLVLSVLGCDPVMSQRFRVSPAPDTATGRSVARGLVNSTGALRMLHGVAEQYGLLHLAPSRSGCTQEWHLQDHFPDVEFLVLCAQVHADSVLEVWISEGITSRWTPKGDSLRRALTDSLARFGLVPVP